jgi:predicted nucleic acid-binding protein
MTIFVDTSALYAVLCQDDANYVAAAQYWKQVLLSEESLVCTNYVLIETIALLQHRLGMKAVKVFQDSVCPVFSIEWIDSDHHNSAVDSLLTANRRNLSLVDCTSFVIMRHLGIQNVFAFDEHFAEQGFTCLPA